MEDRRRTVWVTGNYDPETNLAFFGTGNGGPTIGDNRPGDNLYTSSTIAFDVSTGAIRGYFQYHPNDSLDYDEVSPPILVDYQRNGRTIKGLVDVARDGYVWFLDRSSLASADSQASRPRIGFVDAKPYVYSNVIRSVDPVTGRPDVDPEHKPGTGKRADFCPGSHGGKTWPPIAFSPKTRMIYIPANNNMCSSNMGAKVRYTPGKGFVGITGSHPFTVPARTISAKYRPGMWIPGRTRGRTNTRNRPTGVRCWLQRTGVQRGNERPEVSCLRCHDRRTTLGVPDELRH